MKLYITINNPDSFFEIVIQTYSIKDELKVRRYREQLDYAVTDFDKKSHEYKILNNKYEIDVI